MFATINSDDINHFKKILGEKNVIQEEEKLDIANTDWMRKYKGSSKLMLQPRSTEEVHIFFIYQKILDNYYSEHVNFCWSSNYTRFPYE